MSDTVCTHSHRTMLYFLAGAAAGVSIALLTAPQSGRETRRKLKQATNDLTHQASRVKTAINEAYRRATVAGKEGFVTAMNGEPARTSAHVQTQRH